MREHLFYLFIPLIITNVLHMLVVKRNLFKFLRIPISEKVFGRNKTYRGILFVTLVNGIVFILLLTIFPSKELDLSPFVGALLGLTYVMFELPNSWLKRRLGIAPGAVTANQLGFRFLDKLDSTFGVSLIYTLINGLDFANFFLIVCMAVMTHWSLSELLYRLKWKESV
jgi:CDP-diacylglycerol--serine O-phosphatidyltransferase